jgi:anti-anti-sigma factor
MSQLSAVQDPIPRLPAAPFECNLIRAGVRAAWVGVTGELDLVTSPQLERTLRAAQLHSRLIVLDTREVSFVDCSGVHVILAANAGADWGVSRLILVPGPAVDRLLKLARVHKQIWTFDLAPSDPVPEGLLPECPLPSGQL